MIKPPQNTWKLEMIQKNNQLMSKPKKISSKTHYPKNSDFSENPKNTEFQNFDPKKISQAYVYIEYQSTPAPPPPPPWESYEEFLAQVHLVHSGCFADRAYK